MTIEEIRGNAPKGATHYLDFGKYVEYYIYAFDSWCWMKTEKDLFKVGLDEKQLEPL